MNWTKKKKMVGTLMMIAGVILVIFAIQINRHVADAELHVAEAEQQQQHPRRLRPVRDEMAREHNTALGQKIHNGIEKMAENRELANLLQIGGAILIVVGIGTVAYRKK